MVLMDQKGTDNVICVVRSTNRELAKHETCGLGAMTCVPKTGASRMGSREIDV